MNINLELDLARNLFGHLDADLRARLIAVVDAPSQETWDNAYSIIVGSNGHMTLWQAVRVVYPAFPNTGPRSGGKGKTAWREPWGCIPTQSTLIAALKAATH